MNMETSNQSRVIRIATACVVGEPEKVRNLASSGEPAAFDRANLTVPSTQSDAFCRRRAAFLEIIANEIARRRWTSDILLLPGGFFSADRYVGDLTDPARIQELSGTIYFQACQSAAKTIEGIVVAGVDGPIHADPLDRGDQLLIAVDGNGMSGLARKTFPEESEAKTSSRGLPPLLVYEPDFGSAARLVNLRHGTALLCVCYDVFGTKDSMQHDRHANFVTRISVRGAVHTRRTELFRAALHRAMNTWRTIVGRCDLVLVGIHGFSPEHSGIGEWIENGFRQPSATYPGRPIIGAAHFTSPSPGLPQARSNKPFAALRGADLQARDHFYIAGSGEVRSEFSVRADALVRLYEVPIGD
jgi:hypothetical protein